MDGAAHLTGLIHILLKEEVIKDKRERGCGGGSL
jgi:hypothetical protein